MGDGDTELDKEIVRARATLRVLLFSTTGISRHVSANRAASTTIRFRFLDAIYVVPTPADRLYPPLCSLNHRDSETPRVRSR